MTYIFDDETQINVKHDSLYGLKLALEAIIQDIEYGPEALGLTTDDEEYTKYRYHLATEGS